jgi:hypothetical protein
MCWGSVFLEVVFYFGWLFFGTLGSLRNMEVCFEVGHDLFEDYFVL